MSSESVDGTKNSSTEGGEILSEPRLEPLARINEATTEPDKVEVSYRSTADLPEALQSDLESNNLFDFIKDNQQSFAAPKLVPARFLEGEQGGQINNTMAELQIFLLSDGGSIHELGQGFAQSINAFRGLSDRERISAGQELSRELVATKMAGAALLQKYFPRGDEAAATQAWRKMSPDDQQAVRYGQMLTATAEYYHLELAARYGVVVKNETGEETIKRFTNREIEAMRKNQFAAYENLPDFPEEMKTAWRTAKREEKPEEIAAETYYGEKLRQNYAESVSGRIKKSWEWTAQDASQEAEYKGREVFQRISDAAYWIWEKTGGKAWLNGYIERQKVSSKERAQLEQAAQGTDTWIDDICAAVEIMGFDPKDDERYEKAIAEAWKIFADEPEKLKTAQHMIAWQYAEQVIGRKTPQEIIKVKITTDQLYRLHMMLAAGRDVFDQLKANDKTAMLAKTVHSLGLKHAGISNSGVAAEQFMAINAAAREKIGQAIALRQEKPSQAEKATIDLTDEAESGKIKFRNTVNKGKGRTNKKKSNRRRPSTSNTTNAA